MCQTQSVSSPFFTFDPPVEVKGRKMYRIVNAVERFVGKENKWIKAGTRGGLVEHPELLDPACPIWVFKSAGLYGATKLCGNIMVQNAEVEDSDIKGNVMIGDGKCFTKKYETDAMFQNSVCAVIQRSTVDSTITQNTYSTRVSGMENQLFINDRALIQNSRLYGDSSFNDHCKVLNSYVIDSCVFDYGLICKSKVTSSSLSGSSAVMKSELINVDLQENAEIWDSRVRNAKMRDKKFIASGRRYSQIMFVPELTM